MRRRRSQLGQAPRRPVPAARIYHDELERLVASVRSARLSELADGLKRRLRSLREGSGRRELEGLLRAIEAELSERPRYQHGFNRWCYRELERHHPEVIESLSLDESVNHRAITHAPARIALDAMVCPGWPDDQSAELEDFLERIRDEFFDDQAEQERAVARLRQAWARYAVRGKTR